MSDTPLSSGLDVVTLSSVQPELTKWLWRGWIPKGALTLLVGDPGVGKSHLSWDWMTRVSTGQDWPDGNLGRKGRTLLLAGEDNVEQTIVPNLRRFGADLNQIDIVRSAVGKGGKTRAFNLKTDCERLEEQVIASMASLVVIDPLNAFQSGLNPNSGVDVRQVTTALATMAQNTGAAVVVLHHFNKKSNGEAMYRATGSIDLVAAARSVLYVVVDPSDPTRRGMYSQKLNIAKAQEAKVFHLDFEGGVVWDEGVSFDPQQAMMPDNDGVVAEAKRFLLGLFESEVSKEIAAKHAQDQAREAGVSLSALSRARVALGVTTSRVGGSGGCWLWSQKDEPERASSHGSEAERTAPQSIGSSSLDSLMSLTSLDSSKSVQREGVFA